MVNGTWMNVINRVISDTVEAQYASDKYVILVRGPPGSGKTTFCDILVKEMRTALKEQVNESDSPQKVRICTSSYYESLGGSVAASAKEYATEDIVASLQAHFVVVIDDLNISKYDWNCIRLAVEEKAVHNTSNLVKNTRRSVSSVHIEENFCIHCNLSIHTRLDIIYAASINVRENTHNTSAYVVQMQI
ncbi:Zinc ion binding protein [Phytophthora megakarya]|uniref:Zinc ion binding protein n=1 Tax=Phytophthora megakarya TaxID=4795 RepID=A0A225V058_9STRA|nr:Zinc ion binding protein [Phytophthora megakarya]